MRSPGQLLHTVVVMGAALTSCANEKSKAPAGVPSAAAPAAPVPTGSPSAASPPSVVGSDGAVLAPPSVSVGLASAAAPRALGAAPRAPQRVKKPCPPGSEMSVPPCFFIL
jgi:hypothetical protein